MEDSKNTRTVDERWSDVMGELRELAKSERNNFHNFNFRGIDSVMNAVGPKLRKHGVSIIPNAQKIMLDTAPSQQGKLTQIVRVHVEYTIRGKSGDSITGSSYGEANDTGDKATAKAMSVAYRTFLLQALCLPTHDTDPDMEGEQLREKSSWEVDIDAVPNAEALQAMIRSWQAEKEVPDEVLCYARARFANLRRGN